MSLEKTITELTEQVKRVADALENGAGAQAVTLQPAANDDEVEVKGKQAEPENEQQQADLQPEGEQQQAAPEGKSQVTHQEMVGVLLDLGKKHGRTAIEEILNEVGASNAKEVAGGDIQRVHDMASQKLQE